MNSRWPKAKAMEAAAAILGLCLLAFVIIDESSYQSQYLGGGGRRSLAAEESQLMKNEQNKQDARADKNYEVLPQHRGLATPNYLVSEDPRKQLRFKKKESAPDMFKLTPGVIPPEVVDTVRLLTLRLLENVDSIYAFDESDPRPVMNTFFSDKTKGTIQEEDAQILAVWKHAWSAAGWNPRVLNLSHAKLHPDYDSANNDVKTKVPIHPSDEYNQLCYLRHFAMAAVGGGWMSDYDTVPIGSELTADKYGVNLPNGGMFTTFQKEVPSLIVGSAKEWDRIAKRLIVEGIKAKDDKESLKPYSNPKRHGWFLFSDMHSFSKLIGLGEVISSERGERIKGIEPAHIHSLDNGTTVCNLTREWWAIHFAHKSFGLYGNGELHGTVERRSCKCRALVMAATLQHLSDTCGGIKFHFDEPELYLQDPDTFLGHHQANAKSRRAQ